jgi:hypothetical protein
MTADGGTSVQRQFLPGTNGKNAVPCGPMTSVTRARIGCPISAFAQAVAQFCQCCIDVTIRASGDLVAMSGYTRKRLDGIVVPVGIILSIASAHAQTPAEGQNCFVPKFSGASSAAGAVATMQVVNNGKDCGLRLTSRGMPVISITVVEQPSHGSVAVTPGRVAYTPAAGYAGKDEFKVISEPPEKVLIQVTVLAKPAS